MHWWLIKYACIIAKFLEKFNMTSFAYWFNLFFWRPLMWIIHKNWVNLCILRLVNRVIFHLIQSEFFFASLQVIIPHFRCCNRIQVNNHYLWSHILIDYMYWRFASVTESICESATEQWWLALSSLAIFMTGKPITKTVRKRVFCRRFGPSVWRWYVMSRNTGTDFHWLPGALPLH